MKHIGLILVIALISVMAVHSQSQMKYGIKGGINFTNMSEDFFAETDYKTGFHIGALAELPFGKKFSLQPEILYSTFGVKAKEILLAVPYPGAPGIEPIEAEIKLNYIQVPVLAKFYLAKSLSLELGPSFNFLVSDEYVRPNSTIKDIGESFEFGGVLGVSYLINSNLFANVRYNHGFTNSLSNDYIDSRNYGFLLGVGYLF